jgi:coenzyme F420 hydrogenase subunit beta
VSHPSTLAEVVRHGLCTGCGLCQSMAGPDRIRLEMTADGFLRPTIRQKLSAEEERRILSACPGNRQHAAPEPDARIDPLWGPIRRLARGQATDEEMRFKAASGGVISALCTYLLAGGDVDAILHTIADPAQALRSIPQVSRSPQGVMQAAGARYGPAAPLTDLEAMLAAGRPFALVGKPCDIAAVRNLARLDPRVDRLVRYRIAFFCAGVSSLGISQAIVGKYGLVEDQVRLMRYRGHGCPGLTRIEAKDGRVFEQTYDDSWGNELAQEIQFRCKICPDATGEQADIACGDAWITADGYAHGEYESWNAVIARTAAGEALLARMERDGKLNLLPNTVAELNRMQPHQGERKMAILARSGGLRLAGQPRPHYTGLRIFHAAWLGRHGFIGNLLGTLRRLRRGANREAEPA